MREGKLIHLMTCFNILLKFSLFSQFPDKLVILAYLRPWHISGLSISMALAYLRPGNGFEFKGKLFEKVGLKIILIIRE